jgi:tetratricopeptide (TPR) repeat protein
LLATYGVVAALLAQGNSQGALDIARAMLSYRAEDGRLWTLIGAAEARLGHGDAAQDAFEKAARFEPWNRDALLGMADLALARKDWRRRVSMLRLLTQAMPDSSWTWVALSEAYLHVNQPSGALVSAEHALSVDPQSADALLWKGIALAAAKRQHEAIDTINRSLQGKLHLPTWGWSALGQTYFDVKLYPESIAAYREAVKLAPEDKALRGSLGLVLKEGGYYTEALTVFEKLKNESPNDPFAWRQVCFVYAATAQAQKAIPACERSLEIDPAQPKVWYPLMEQYHAAGRRADVKRAYEKLSLLDRALSESAYRRLLLPYEGAP